MYEEDKEIDHSQQVFMNPDWISSCEILCKQRRSKPKANGPVPEIPLGWMCSQCFEDCSLASAWDESGKAEVGGHSPRAALANQ